MRLHKTHELASFKALEHEEPGTFEAVVSVFGNVDLQGDRTMPGAFKRTLKSKREKGDPIPVIWSHDWLNPDAHIGWADPNDVTEIPIGGKSSGVTGGLLVKGHIDVHKPFAAQVFDLLKERRVREWSFAYDVAPGGERKADDGANELTDLDLHEVGPCLKGANPVTYTIGAKSAMETELKEAWDASRALSRFIELIKNVDDAEVARALTKSYLNPAEARTRRYHVEIDGKGFACVSNSNGEKVDFHESDEEAAAHIKRLETISSQAPKMSEEEIRAALDLGPAPEPKEELDISDLEAAVAEPEKAEKHTTVNVVIDGYKFQVDPEALVLDEEIEEKAEEAEDKVAGKPWHIEKRGDQYCVIKDADGSEAGCHDSLEDAEAQVRALYANESSVDPEAEKTPSGFRITQRGSEYCVMNADTGEEIACFTSHKEAADYVHERRAAQNDGKALVAEDSDLEETESVAEVVADEETKALITNISIPATTSTSSNGSSYFINVPVDGIKAGRVVGSKAAAALKTRLGEAVDAFVAEVNGAAEETKTEEEVETKAETPSEWLERLLEGEASD